MAYPEPDLRLNPNLDGGAQLGRGPLGQRVQQLEQGRLGRCRKIWGDIKERCMGRYRGDAGEI